MPRPHRKPLKAPEALEAILERAGESRFARVRPPVPAKVWREAVGARIAERARPAALFGGVLTLHVASSVWAHELSLLATELCTRLRERGVEVRELRFRVTPMGVVDRPPERRAARAVPKTLAVPAEVTRSLASLGDDDLRAAIASAAAANLAWQELTRPAPPGEVSEARRGARAPRGAAEGTAPQAPARPASREGEPRSPSGDRGRSR
jgi:hypothetical protein